MKKLKILLFTLIATTSLSAQFEICNSNTLKSLNDVYFFDVHIGIAVGDSGIITRSTDGGLNWNKVIEIDSINFIKVKLWDDTHGIAIGTKIYTTNNGGLNWKYQKIFKEDFYSDVELFDNYEFIVKGGLDKISRLQLVNENIHVIFEKSIDYNLLHMSFINDSTGYAHHFDGSEVSSFLQTLDGGRNWNKIDFETGVDFTLIEDIVFISDEIGFMGGWYNPHLMKTTDGGFNWTTVNILNSDNAISDLPYLLDFHIEISQSNIFYSCGWHGEIFKSIDLGTNWERLKSPVPSNTSLKGIYFVNDTIGWAVGDFGTIIKTQNGGQLTSTSYFAKSELTIYPNPFEELIQIDLLKTQFEKIKLYNMSGKLLKVSDQDFIDGLENLNTGVYILAIENEHSSKQYKVVKK